MPKKLSLEATLMFHELCKEMRAKETQQIRIEFSGGGDSGAINDVIFTPPRRPSKKEKVYGGERVVRDLFYKIIGEHGYDFYNDAGGYGSLVIDVEKRTWSLEITFYEIVSADHDYDLEEEMERVEIEGPTTKGGASLKDFKKILLSKNREERARAITLLPELLPELREQEKQGGKELTSKPNNQRKNGAQPKSRKI